MSRGLGVKFGIWVIAVVAVSIATRAEAQRLDQTAVGRFGAGHRITSNTASQDLLAWNTVCDGKSFELRVYDRRARPVSLGGCGLTGAPSKLVLSRVEGITWTGLICRMSLGSESVVIRESLLTPVLWISTSANQIRLFRSLPGRGKLSVRSLEVPGRRGSGSYLAHRDRAATKPWFLATVQSGDQAVPVLAILERAPSAIDVQADGSLIVRWATVGNRIGLLPLEGSRPAAASVTPQPFALADRLAELFLWIPSGLKEAYRVTNAGVAITNRVSLDAVKDQWGWWKRTKGYTPVPPVVSNAKRYGYPVVYDRKVQDTGYATYTSSFCLAPNAREVTYTLPRPDIYGTIVAPVADPVLSGVYAPEVQKTIRDYSDYVLKTYKGKPEYVFPTSAIGEGRWMTADYNCYRLMTPEARKAFDAWADAAAKDRIFNREGFYGYGKDVASPRRFLIDKYRLGGSDFMDAGWFGYDVATMWERAHFAGKWGEIRQNWNWIREMFYGWNWVYTDYAVGYAPLYVDAGNGGASKGYTDNMAMLPALYGWARMADKLGDGPTFADALYMLARDRMGRYNRMTVHDYAKRCGYESQSVVLVSDQGNGPSLSLADRYVPPDSKQWTKGAVNDFGDYRTGLWLLTGSFLEPPSIETVDMILAGDMKRRVAATNALVDKRYPRWWAAPTSAEMANYQIFLRGVLFGDDPVRLRHYFDYQDGFGSGVWATNAWHAYAFLGIALSQNRTLELRRNVKVAVWRGRGWGPPRDDVETGVIVGKDNRRYVTLWNGTKTSLRARLSVDPPGLGEPLAALKIVRLGNKPAVLKNPGTLELPVGLSVIQVEPVVEEAAKGKYRALTASVPEAIQVLNGQSVQIPVGVWNGLDRAVEARVTLAAPGAGPMRFVLPARAGRTVAVSLKGPSECVAPYLVSVSVEAGGLKIVKAVQVLVLPSVVARLDLEGDGFVRAPRLGSANIYARNRLSKPVTLDFAWSFGAVANGAQKLELAANGTGEWNLPFDASPAQPEHGTLRASVETPAFGKAQRERRITILPALGVIKEPTEIVLYDFEEDSDGWYMPSWADGNQTDAGAVYKPYASVGEATRGKKALESPIRITAGRGSAAFFGTPVAGDWRSFDTIGIDVYLPPNAPAGLEARYYLIGSDWQWREPEIIRPLVPGKWTTLTIPLKGPDAARIWKVSEEKLRDMLSRVLDTGVKICNVEPGFVGYRGIVRLDNFRATGL